MADNACVGAAFGIASGGVLKGRGERGLDPAMGTGAEPMPGVVGEPNGAGAAAGADIGVSTGIAVALPGGGGGTGFRFGGGGGTKAESLIIGSTRFLLGLDGSAHTLNPVA